jgi:hypothetical protein
MRVAAGVLLIIAAVINLFAGILYVGGGAMVGGANKFTAMAAEAQRKKGRDLTDEQKEEFAQLNEAQRQTETDPKAARVVRAMMGYGSFLLVTVGTSIAGAVCLFRRRAPKVIVATAAVLLLAEAIGCVAAGVLLGRTALVMKIFSSSLGILGGIFALVGARQVSFANAPPVDMPVPTATPM